MAPFTGPRRLARVGLDAGRRTDEPAPRARCGRCQAREDVRGDRQVRRVAPGPRNGQLQTASLGGTWASGVAERTRGKRRGGRSPSMTCRSVRQMAQARTRTRSSSAPGSGTASSRAARGFFVIGACDPRTMARIGRRCLPLWAPERPAPIPILPRRRPGHGRISASDADLRVCSRLHTNGKGRGRFMQEPSLPLAMPPSGREPCLRLRRESRARRWDLEERGGDALMSLLLLGIPAISAGMTARIASPTPHRQDHLHARPWCVA
jgi:hypothetical protein